MRDFLQAFEMKIYVGLSIQDLVQQMLAKILIIWSPTRSSDNQILLESALGAFILGPFFVCGVPPYQFLTNLSQRSQ